MDRTNYAPWLPIYIADMSKLHKTHPNVYEEFVSYGHSIRRSSQPFSSVWTNMELAQSINLDCKSKGGIVGISKNKAAVDSIHNMASIDTQLKNMVGLKDSTLLLILIKIPFLVA